MKTYKRLNIDVRRGRVGWIIEGREYTGNKGQCVLEYLRQRYLFTGKGWVAK